jgi:hypothetical protein
MKPWETRIEDHFDGQMSLGKNVSHRAWSEWKFNTCVIVGATLITVLAVLLVYRWYH